MRLGWPFGVPSHRSGRTGLARAVRTWGRRWVRRALAVMWVPTEAAQGSRSHRPAPEPDLLSKAKKERLAPTGAAPGWGRRGLPDPHRRQDTGMGNPDMPETRRPIAAQDRPRSWEQQTPPAQ